LPLFPLSSIAIARLLMAEIPLAGKRQSNCCYGFATGHISPYDAMAVTTQLRGPKRTA
jgi:hypothetical protein